MAGLGDLKVTTPVTTITDLSDRPQLGSTTALKQKFDYSPEALRVALNAVIDYLVANYATSADLVGLVTGDIPPNSIGTDKLSFDPATQAELDAHKSGTDHDGRYFTETEVTNELALKLNKSLFTAQGDIPYGAGAGTALTIAKGLYLQALQMNASENAPQWGNVMTGNKQIFTASETFTAPKTGVYKVIVTGGGGSSGRTNGSYGVSGGGGGGTAIKWVSLTKGDAVTVTVGAGGTYPPVNGNYDGGAGGTSSFGSHCSATGGNGGSYMAANPSTGYGVDGGYGSNGDINLYGERSPNSFYSSGANVYQSGKGGASYWGNDSSYGAGSGYSGGNTGIVVVEW